MGRCGLPVLLLLSVSAVPAFCQTGTSIPSNDEILELVAKAEQKVSGFENAVKSVKPDLDKVDPKLSTTYADAGAAAPRASESGILGKVARPPSQIPTPRSGRSLFICPSP